MRCSSKNRDLANERVSRVQIKHLPYESGHFGPKNGSKIDFLLKIMHFSVLKTVSDAFFEENAPFFTMGHWFLGRKKFSKIFAPRALLGYFRQLLANFQHKTPPFL